MIGTLFRLPFVVSTARGVSVSDRHVRSVLRRVLETSFDYCGWPN